MKTRKLITAVITYLVILQWPTLPGSFCASSTFNTANDNVVYEVGATQVEQSVKIGMLGGSPMASIVKW